MEHEHEQANGQPLSRREWLAGLGAVGAGLGLAAVAGTAAAQGEAERVVLAVAAQKTPVRWVNTIGTTATPGALRGVDETFADTVVVLGFWLPGDSGGGVFYWSTDLTPDNGGTVIVPYLSPRTGCWKRVTRGPVSVAWFGAKGDGTASDDSGAIQAAIAAVKATGGTVYVPAGTYNIKKQLDLSFVSNVSLVGDGYGSFLNFTVPDVGIGGDYAHHVEIACLRLGGASGRVIAFGNSDNITIHNTNISGATRGDPQHAPGSSTPAGIFFGNVNHVWVTDNHLEGNGTTQGGSDILVSTSGGSYLHVRGNRCLSNIAVFGICLFNVSYSTIADNIVASTVSSGQNNNGYGILLYALDNAQGGHNVVQGNTVRNTDGSGIYLRGNPYSVVTGNVVENTAKKQDNGDLPVGGIAVDNGAPATGGRVAIVGNVIRQSGEAGISVVDRGSVISANVIENVAGRGIEIRGDRMQNTAPDQSAVVGNTVTDALIGIGTVVPGGGVSGLAVVGNTISNINKVDPNTPGAGGGIVLDQESISNSTLSNNTVSDTGSYGIDAVKAISSSFVGNTMAQVKSPGLQIHQGTGNVVVGNVTPS